MPNAGDFYTGDIARQPLLMLRGPDGAVRVLLNRCAHKSAKILGACACACACAGNCNKLLRCSYHGWTYTLDGSLRTVPLKSGHAGARFAESHHLRHTGDKILIALKKIELLNCDAALLSMQLFP